MEKQYMMNLFAYKHLPEHLQAVSQTFRILAISIWDNCPPGENRDISLRLLVQAKDAAVRAKVMD